MRFSPKEPRKGSFDIPRRVPLQTDRGHPGRLRRRLFWLSALLLLAIAYFVMAPDAPNLPTSPEQGESIGRTAY